MRFFRRHWILSIFIVLVSFVLVRAYWLRDTDPYLLATGEIKPFTKPASFADYMRRERASLQAARAKAGLDASEKVMDIVSPFEIRPQQVAAGKIKRGLLYFHAYGATPSLCSDVLPFFKKAGFLIRGITLPGHGSCPGDLKSTDLSEWLACTEWAAENMAEEVDELYIMGTSIGGGLALSLATLEQASYVKGLILEVPMVEITWKLAWLAPYLEWVMWLDPKLRWTKNDSQRIPQFYAAYPMHAASNIDKLRILIAECLKKPVRASICSFLTTDDETVDPYAFWKWAFARQNTQDVHTIFATEPLAITPPAANTLVVQGKQPEFGSDIISYSHACLLTAPSNPTLGKSFRYCGHYKQEDPLRAQCLDMSQPITLGSTTSENLEKYSPMARLRYNPCFDKVTAQLGKYLLGMGAIDAALAKEMGYSN